MAVTPQPGAASVVTTGGTAVVAVVGGPAGGFIVNPASSADQGLGGDPEDLIVSPVAAPGSAAGDANGTAFRISPGGIWNLIPGQSTPTYVNAPSDGHKFSVVFWP